MNDAMRKRIAALNLEEIINELDELLAEEGGIDGNRGHWKVRNALQDAASALGGLHYYATTPRKDWD